MLAIGYFQPVTRGELSKMFGREISRDLIANQRSDGFVGAGPRSPQPGAPYTYVTTPGFLAQFGFQTLRDLPDLEMLEDAGLLSKARLLAEILPAFPGELEGEGEDDAAEEVEEFFQCMAMLPTNERPRPVGLLMVSRPAMSYRTAIPLIAEVRMLRRG